VPQRGSYAGGNGYRRLEAISLAQLTATGGGTETITVRRPARATNGRTATLELDVAHLKRRLEETVAGEVRFDAGAKGLYATDASNYRQIPIGVVIPKTVDDVVAAHRACHEFGAPIVARGCGTSLSGETVNYAVVIDFSKYLHAIGETDAERRTITCQPGAINEHVNLKTGEHDLVFGPDPSTHSRCTVGGNLGNNSCGIHSVQSQIYGPGPRTADNVCELEIVTYDGERLTVGVGEEARLEEIIAGGGRKGEIYAKLRDLRDRYAAAIRAGYPSVEEVPRRVSGYNLDELLPEKGFNVARALVGTEGTCVNVLSATLMLTPALLCRTTVVVEYDDIFDAGTHVPEIMEFKPIALEALDSQLIEDQQQLGMNTEDLQQLPRLGDNAWLLVQFGADSAQDSIAQAERFCSWLRDEKGYAEDRIKVFRSEQEGGESSTVWEVRESGLGSTAFPEDGDHWPGWEDSAVPPGRIGDYLRELKGLLDAHGIKTQFYGHFGQGCIHGRASFDLRTPAGLRTYRAFMEQAGDLVVRYGGSLSGEHGDGQQRAELLEKQYGRELMDAMREFKRIWDPDWKMNPGKVVDPYRLDEDLKLGVDYNPRRPDVRFAYQEDGGDFAHAMLRCVGVGKCRVPDAEGVMCPSFQVTREEKHSTRGRARLLFEMLEGDVITDGWDSREVYEALDLCLACKGCSNDCPVNVDMPTYKAEFLHHHYKGLKRRRPRHAYAFGFIDQAARLAARLPGLVNALAHHQPTERLAKLLAGMDARRAVPTFAPITLQRWFARRGGSQNPTGRRVVLWPDTFNNHFYTDVGVACVEALEAAGWNPVIPQRHVCCGRPLYDYGFLDQAERYLRNTLDVLRDEIRAGTPVVGMEPSCLAVFKDELGKMLPHDDDAQRLAANAYHWSEFFQQFDVPVPRLDREVLLWGHCHHKATGGIDPEQQLLERMGAQVRMVSGGCCGLAGSWGFEAGKQEISMACGEQALLPAVRAAHQQTVVVANGFSCKTQIEQAGTGRRALHVAQLMTMAREHGSRGCTGELPEKPYSERRPAAPTSVRVARAAALAAGAATLGAIGAAATRRGS
jgi:FAD/FMN-containing dehydrogenase/Fe-S oxidoreductase